MSGKAEKIEFKTMTLLPAKRGTCPDCAVIHEPEMPHNPDSMYYQVKFMMEHGRGAKWSDAMAHCTDAVKAYWKEALLKKGVSEDQFIGGGDMNKTKIDWADSTWNPVTGCLHGCEYCYARKVAERFKGGGYGMETPLFIGKYKEDAFSPPYVLDAPQLARTKEEWYRDAPYPFGFEPTFHRYRLNEYKNKMGRNIFVCSMADLFGDWVPDEWIQEVFKACEAAPQHRYLFLTKNTKRYEKLLDHEFPTNMWFGWSQDGPMGYEMAHITDGSIQSFVSIEPLRRPFDSFDVKGLGWAIVGAETGNQTNKVVPEKAWVDAIVTACKEAGVPVFMKSSLRELMGDDFIQEYPWSDPGKGHN